MFEKLSSEFIKARNLIFFIRAFLKRVEKTNLNERCNKEEMFSHNPSEQGCAILYCNILELPITYCNTFMTAVFCSTETILSYFNPSNILQYFNLKKK